MAIDFQKINSTDLLTVDDITIKLIEGLITVFNNRYQDLFDYYGTFRLYQNHQEYLRELLISLRSSSQTIKSLISLLDECIETGSVLIGIGD